VEIWYPEDKNLEILEEIWTPGSKILGEIWTPEFDKGEI